MSNAALIITLDVPRIKSIRIALSLQLRTSAASNSGKNIRHHDAIVQVAYEHRPLLLVSITDSWLQK